jgi:hypothetical protein
MRDTTFGKKNRRLLDDGRECAGTTGSSFENVVVPMAIFVRSGKRWAKGDSFGESDLHLW